jgi:hypothetical protein
MLLRTSTAESHTFLVMLTVKFFLDKYSIMLLDELYKPKIGKKVVDTAQEYYANRHGSEPRDYNEGLDWLQAKLSSLGWHKLNSGGYSYVFANPKKNYVLKVNTIQDNGYDQFVQIIHRSRNKHFPRISDRKTMEFDGDEVHNFRKNVYHVYLIEKLEELPEPKNDNYASILSVIMSVYHEEWNPSLKTALDWLERDYFTEEEFPSIKEFILRHKELAKAAAILGNAQKYHKLNNDLHSRNIMQRADGTVVIVDPYV